MEKENTPLSRREFLKVSGLGMLAFANLPRRVEQNGEGEPLTDLPKFITDGTPVKIETLTRNGNWIDPATAPAYFLPEWVSLTGIPLDILPNIRPERDLDVPNAQGPVAWVTEVPHATGIHAPLMKVVVGFSQDESKTEILNGAPERKNEDIVATYAFSDRSRIYPSKIYNILTVLGCISEWQEGYGPFAPGQIYSYLEMSGVAHRNAERFLTGGYLDAGGICATVATMSKCVFIASAKGLTGEVRRRMHQPNLRYAENPLDPAITKLNSDATVEWVRGQPDNYVYNTDYKFELLPDCPPLYFSFSAHLVLNETPSNPNSPARHRNWPSDARLTFTISLTNQAPNFAAEREALFALRAQYEAFHNFNDGFLGGRDADGVILRP